MINLVELTAIRVLPHRNRSSRHPSGATNRNPAYQKGVTA
jgi:hypothetical protein